MKSRILVIDDEAAIRDSMRMILEYEGYECLLAPTGPEGLTTVEREDPRPFQAKAVRGGVRVPRP